MAIVAFFILLVAIIVLFVWIVHIECMISGLHVKLDLLHGKKWECPWCGYEYDGPCCPECEEEDEL